MAYVDQGPPATATDGQSFWQQPPDVQQTFLAVWGTEAPARWVAEHNAQLMTPPSAPPPGNQPAPPPQQVAPPPRQNTILTTPNVIGTREVNPDGTPSYASWRQFQGQFRPGGVYRNAHNGFPYLFDGQRFRAIRSGQVDSGGPGNVQVEGEFIAGLGPEDIGPDLLDTSPEVQATQPQRQAAAPPTVGTSGAPGAIGLGGQPAPAGMYQTPFGPANEKTPPGNMGLEWWKEWTRLVGTITDDSGVIHDPITGKPLSSTDGSLQRTLTALRQEAEIRQADEGLRQSQLRIDDARRAGDLDRVQRESEYARTLQLDRDRLAQDQTQFDATLGYNIGQALGRLQGQNTLERDRFEEDRANAAYQRAAQPINAFEEELRRSTGGTYWNTATGQAQVGQAPATVAPAVTAQPVAAVAQGVMRPAVEPDANSPMRTAAPAGNTAGVRVPAFLQVLRSGGVTPTVGQINAPNVEQPANQAALTRTDLLTMNRRAEPRLSSVQRMIRSSYSKAGGIGAEEEADLLNLGMPKERSIATSISAR